MSDEKANIFKVQYLSGRHGCKCGRHKREGGSALPGEIWLFGQCATGVERCWDEPPEVSRGHSRFIDRTEGPNMKYRKEP
jgi:hypothetical protein